MSGKLVTQQKAKKKHGAAFYIIGTFTFAIEAMLGINAAFLVWQSIAIVADNMLADTFLAPLAGIITLVVSLAVGFCFIAGGMWTFGGFMDSLDDARAYRDKYGTGQWPVLMVWVLALAVVALDLTTLLFRASYFAEKGASALFVFFLILIVMPFVLGLLIHVLENTPRDRRLAKARMYAESLETDDIEAVVQTMDPDLRTRWLEDDPSALQEHYNRVEAMRKEAEDFEQQRMAEREEKRRNKQRPLLSASLAQQARLGSPENQK